jgi:ferric-dicitrate binding protein FerR (iron transport regulator)
MPAISAALLEKFLKGICSEEEAAIVEAYFEQNPDEIFLLDEYEAGREGPELPAGYREEMREAISAATLEKQKSRLLVLRPYLSAAVALLLLACWWLLRPAADKKVSKPQERLAVIWVGQHNSDSKKLKVQLPDSSEAVLYPGTTISYRKDFGHYDQREVKVEGQVIFTVIKDKEMPFVVATENVRTTVLGTIFEVTAEKSSDQIKVRLMEGNLLVRVDRVARDSAKKYFLSPGQEFVYGKWNNSVVVRKFESHGGGYAVPRLSRLPVGQDSLHNWYMFNNQSLSEVFDQLALLYDVDIEYSGADLRNKFFIGKLERKDSLSKIMSDIARLNHLSVTIKGGKYIVAKQKP